MHEYYEARAAVRMFVEGRTEIDPTISLAEKDRECMRQEGLDHLRRREQTRIARVRASQYRAGRSCDGELVDSQPTGSPVSERRLADCWPPRWVGDDHES